MLTESPFIDFKIRSVSTDIYHLPDLYQIGTPRPANGLGDIGSIEEILPLGTTGRTGICIFGFAYLREPLTTSNDLNSFLTA